MNTHTAQRRSERRLVTVLAIVSIVSGTAALVTSVLAAVI